MAVIISLLLVQLIQGSVSTISWDTGCGVTKGCFPACQDGCQYLVTWQAGTTGVDFVLKAEKSDSNVYLAIGFSDDYRMGDDSVSSCMVAGGTVISTFNAGTDSETLDPPTLGVSVNSVSQTSGVITCNFTRSFSAPDSRFYNLNNDYILMLVIGETKQKNGVYEMGEHDMIPWSSSRKVDFNSNGIVGLYKLNSPLVKLHGIMMVLAWMFFSTVGILIARYNKDMLDPRKLFGTKYWFQLHRACMVVVLIFVVIGFISIFVEIQGYSQLTPPSSKAVTASHPVLGIIITVLTILNPIGALLRPAGDHKYRWMFNWVHFGAGVISFLLAVITMFFGHVTERGMLPDSAIYVTLVHVLLIVGVVIGLEIHKFLNKNKKEVKVNGAGVHDGGPTQMKEKSSNNTASQVPLYILLAFVAVDFAVTMGVLGIIAAS